MAIACLTPPARRTSTGRAAIAYPFAPRNAVLVRGRSADVESRQPGCPTGQNRHSSAQLEDVFGEREPRPSGVTAARGRRLLQPPVGDSITLLSSARSPVELPHLNRPELARKSGLPTTIQRSPPYVLRFQLNLSCWSALRAMKNPNEKLPFGDWVNEKLAVQSCRSRCRFTIWLGNCRLTKS